MGALGKALLIAAAGALIAGCRSQPIHDVVAAPIPVVGAAASMDDVMKAIVKGGVRAGWEILPETPGRLSGRYVRGPHRATVDITHDTKTYDIRFRDSTMTSADGSVHRTYNLWVQDLDRALRAELVQLNR